MSDYSRCTTCSRYDYLSRHTCWPKWRVWIDGRHDFEDAADYTTIHALDAEDAARDAVERASDDGAEGEYIGDDVLVLVRADESPKSDGEWFLAGGEPSVDWSAAPVPAPALSATTPKPDTNRTDCVRPEATNLTNGAERS
jgi:hypothetical protein